MRFLCAHNGLLASMTFLMSVLHSCYGNVLKSSATSTPLFPNSTYISPTKSSTQRSTTVSTNNRSSSESPSTTPAAILSSATTAKDTSLITKGPLWGNQTIPINTCSTLSNGVTVWNPCSVFAGTVHLSYFPENYGNCSRCATEYYDPMLSMTLTSPSVYLVVNTLYGYNKCGPLGPNYVGQAFAMALDDVSTLPPYADASATTRDPARRLTLSDLENCSKYTSISTQGVLTEARPVSNDYNRCNPRLWVPMEFKRVGYPYWMHCGNRNYEVGVFDPPGAIPTADSLFVSTIPAQYTPTYGSAIVAATPEPAQASSTSTPNFLNTLIDSTQSNGELFLQSKTPPSPTTTSPAAIAVIGSNTLLAIPGSSGIILPGDSTATIGQVATVTDSSGSKAIVSVGTYGIYIAGVGTDFNPTFYANPTVEATPISAAIAIATIAGQVVSAAPGAPSVVINGQTVTLEGQAITLAGTNDVVTLGLKGLVVQYPSGTVSTFAIPATPTHQAAVTIAGYIVTATAGVSAIVIGGQTATLGGQAVTLTNGDVVSLGSGGVVVQIPGGGVSTATLPVVSASQSEIPATASAVRVASAIVAIIGATSSTNPVGNADTVGTASATAGRISSAGSVTKRSNLAWLCGGALGAVFWI